jgi:hypothetical protein
MAKKKVIQRAPRSTKSSRNSAVNQLVEWSEDDTEFRMQVSRELNRLNQEGSVKDFRKYANMLVQSSGLFSKDEIVRFTKVPDRLVPQTICSLGVMHVKSNLPINEWIEGHVKRFVHHVQDLVGVEPSESTPKKEVSRPSIQDYLTEKTNEIIGELEGDYDLVIQNKAPKYKPLEFLKHNQVVVTQLSKYIDVYQTRKEELELAQRLSSEIKVGRQRSETVEDSELSEQLQIIESYRHYNNKDYKRLIGWIDDLLNAIEQYKTTKKSNVVRKVSPAVQAKRNATKATKIKYLKSDDTYNLNSVSPISIIGATELWVFNVKTRKLGKYVAQDYQTLDVSGTTIKNFNVNKSICKTLRKPQEQLKEFNKLGKVALRTFIDTIKSTETKLNGRLNEDTILLKVQN